MGADGSPAAASKPWRKAAAQVFLDDLTAPEMGEDDARHLLRVLRLRDGELVCAADGAGGWRMCRLAGEALEPEADAAREERAEPLLTVGFAPPKGDRPEWAVQKVAELGVDRIVLLRSQRSVVRWSGERADKQLAKLRRTVLEACRQSRRLWLPEVSTASFEELGEGVLADAGGRALTERDTTVLVGPEGGWADEEREGRELVGLGDAVLRSETAAVAAGVRMTALRLGL